MRWTDVIHSSSDLLRKKHCTLYCYFGTNISSFFSPKFQVFSSFLALMHKFVSIRSSNQHSIRIVEISNFFDCFDAFRRDSIFFEAVNSFADFWAVFRHFGDFWVFSVILMVFMTSEVFSRSLKVSFTFDSYIMNALGNGWIRLTIAHFALF